MEQQPIELILTRRWAALLAMPVWVMDVDGNLVFYNEPAEALVGARFDEVGPIHASELAKRFETTALDGEPIPNEDLPIVVALREWAPSHMELRARALDGAWRLLAITAVPIVGHDAKLLGALAAFWEHR